MADISQDLQKILDAIYGEEVRGSIYHAISLINDVSEVILTTGTAITAPTDSSEGYFTDSLYLNTNTYELWKCVGTNAWQSLGILKGATGNGIDNITKTSTSGLVDTYTITYTDGTSDTFDITNGEDGDNGNRWYRGTAVSGKAVLPTVYPTGIADANANDFYLNPSEGAIYHCVMGGDDTTATWAYDFTMSGGGSSVSTLNDLTDVTISTPSSGQALVFDGTGWSNGNVSAVGDLDDLSDVTITTPTSGQVLKYDGTKWENGTAPSGGMLPYLYIDSEAGATVTVVQPDSTTITPTAAGSGHWECELTGGYGTYVIHSVLSGQGDATQSLAVDTVKEYHVTDTHYDFTINVTAPSGSTVRIVGGGETYTGTGTGTSQAFAVHTPSTTYTVTATQIMDGNTKTDEATVTSASTSGGSTNVTLSIEFGTINVTVAADFVTAGSTITCVNGGTSCTPKTAASTLVFRVPTTGTWTISGTIGSDTYSTAVTVTNLGTAVSANLATIPEGSTVTPTDDIQTWLNCAGIYDKTSYASLSDVLGDSTTLLAVMSDSNAVDYLVRSTTWISGICGDSTAMTDIGANNYCADTLLADADWSDAIINSAYYESVLNVHVPTLSADTTSILSSAAVANYPAYHAYDNNWSKSIDFNSAKDSYYATGNSDKYLGYDFGATTGIKFFKIRGAQDGTATKPILKDAKIEYSDDNTTWSDATEQFTIDASQEYIGNIPSLIGKHRYWRAMFINVVSATGRNVAVKNLQFYGREDV